MIRLFLTVLLCGLDTYSVTTLGSDAYQHKAICTFQSEGVVNFAQTYRYDDTVLTTSYPSKMTYNLELYSDIYYTDIYNYRIVVKAATFTGLNYWYYDNDNSTWVECGYIGQFSHITINNTSGYSWTNNSCPDHIAFYTSCSEDDYLDVTFNGCFIQPNSTISTTGFATTGYVSVGGWLTNYTSLTYLNTLSESETNRVYYELDYNMFYDTLVLLVGADSSFNDGYSIGYNVGSEEGFNSGRDVGYTEGKVDGYADGKRDGYIEGLRDGENTDATINSIYTGILAIGFIPINFFLAIFNFEILGINLSEFVSSILSVCVVIIIIKRVFSTEGGD